MDDIPRSLNMSAPLTQAIYTILTFETNIHYIEQSFIQCYSNLNNSDENSNSTNYNNNGSLHTLSQTQTSKRQYEKVYII